jgi:hypothetical protein
LQKKIATKGIQTLRLHWSFLMLLEVVMVVEKLFRLILFSFEWRKHAMLIKTLEFANLTYVTLFQDKLNKFWLFSTMWAINLTKCILQINKIPRVHRIRKSARLELWSCHRLSFYEWWQYHVGKVPLKWVLGIFIIYLPWYQNAYF